MVVKLKSWRRCRYSWYVRPAKIEEYERKRILDTLQKTNGWIRGENGAAELIGIKPTTLEARVKKLKIAKAEIFK